jgi:hypothetical protein
MSSPDQRVGLTDEFHTCLGQFWAAWASAELTVDYMIHKLLRISQIRAHHLLAGMEAGRKMRLLEGLLHRSEIKQKAIAIGCLRKLQNESLRNAFAHSFLWSDRHFVTFVNRAFGQKYEVKEHKFSMIRFRMHVRDFILNATAFYDALEIDYDDLQSFGKAALRASRNSTKSPKPPSSKA